MYLLDEHMHSPAQGGLDRHLRDTLYPRFVRDAANDVRHLNFATSWLLR